MVGAAIVVCAVLSGGPAIRPWWDTYAAFVQDGDAARARAVGATASLCGAADDAGWGIWGQRIRVQESGRRTTDAFHAAGLKALTWVEGFGNAGLYVVQLKRQPDGAWTRCDGTDLTRVWRNHWGWSKFDGTGEVRWVGIHTYWDDADYARPYTLTHPRYGAPPVTYPDGTVARGYTGSPLDPRRCRVFDAAGGKNVLGQAFAGDRSRPLITDVLRGVAKADSGAADANAPTIVPDPGFTPAEWAARSRGSGALTIFEADKDSACPAWIDYARAEARLALDTGVDGFWVDNFSPWDSFNASPLHHAFGEWSVARFRDHLRRSFAPARLAAMGVGDLAWFDVRRYLLDKVREWGGRPDDLKDPRWRDRRWQDDPVWRAYLIHKRRCGTEALSQLYRALKDEGARAGRPDVLVMGNDTPAFSLGWPRGDLDQVSTELTWGWWLAAGPRGLMPPPLGSYQPVYKLAREHARSRFVNAWMYGPKEVLGRPHIAEVVQYQALATHATPMPHHGARTLGTDETTAALNAFMRRAAGEFGERRPVEEIGLYYSSSSELVGIVPGFYLDHARQGHSFSFYGWGTVLSWLHTPWRAVPEWKLTADTLRTLRLLIIPNAEVFAAGDVPLLDDWVRAGGRLLIAGEAGRRSGEGDNFERAADGTTLAAFTRPQPRVLWLRDDPGFAFYLADRARPDLLPAFAAHLATVGCPLDSLALTAPTDRWSVGLTPYASDHRLFVDVNNTAIDLATDTITPAAPVSFTLRLPARWRQREVRAHVVAPGAAPQVTLRRDDPERVTVQVGPVTVYASVVVEPAG